ncbi:MAG: glycosyltransferase [Clostridia bacterium]|nr:glycosyltransferase [Clostridia bacterium]
MKKIVLFSLEAGVMGGVAGVNRVLCEMFRSMGYEVLPLYLRRGGEECFEGDVIRPDRNWSFTQGKKILSALKRGRLFTALRFSFCRLAEKRRYEEDCRRARALLKRENPDLILTSHYLLPDAIPEELLSRTVHHVHTSFAATAAVRADLETLRRFNGKIRFLWLSEGICREAEKFGFQNSDYLYNPLSAFPEKRSEAEKSQSVVIITRFSEEKRLPLAVALLREAFDRLPDPFRYRVQIWGFGPEEAKIAEAIGNDSRFQMMGRCSDPFAALKEARLSINTSRFEGFSLSILESSAAGVPTVSFRFGEAAEEEILSGETGVLVPMDDRESFVQSLRDLLCEDETVEKMSRRAREYARRFTLEAVAEDWRSFFDSFWS